MIASLAILAALTGSAPDPLAAGFMNPPSHVQPHTWWHWMNGNSTKEGITADLEAMKEAGIAGAQLFTVDQGIPAGPAGYMGPKWRELTAFAVKEAHRLGIELCLHNCAGWSSSGGPWIKPEDAMQVLAWSEIKVSGPAKVSQKLPPIAAPRVDTRVDWNRDIAVYAFPTPDRAPNRGDSQLGRTGVVRGDGIRPDLTLSVGIDPAAILDITSALDKDGLLEWEAPEGDWTILRLGSVPTGKTNHPAPPEGTGLEVDKLSREAMDKHWNAIVQKVLDDAGPLAGKTLNNALIDSYEVGGQNWTPKFREEFLERRGYDPFKWMLTVAGYTVASGDKTERFLWDARRTIADLFADNYFGRFAELCRKAGIKMSVEPYGNGGFDNIQSGLKADIPMGEFWVDGAAMETIKVAASVGHIKGGGIVGAESFTASEGAGRWTENPYSMKVMGDRAFASGVNRMIFHRFAHQPWLDVSPGMTMGPWGSHFDRTETWWKEAKEWIRYLTRCQYLLQKGQFVADIAYFYGEDAPADLPSRGSLKPTIPAGYDYDGIDASTVKSMTVKNGRLMLPSGMSYSVLVLPESEFMTPGVARKIKSLVESGAKVIGPKPLHTPSLSDFPSSEGELGKIAAGLWGEGTPGQRKVGLGSITTGGALKSHLSRLGVQPDLEVKGDTAGSGLAWIHRRLDGTDIYFLSSQSYRSSQVTASFRTSGRAPELWDPESGEMKDAPGWLAAGGRTTLTLNLSPAESVFVVFRRKAAQPAFAGINRVSDSKALDAIKSIELVKAWYGAANGKGADVTEKVRDLLSAGQTSIPASNSLFGDPAYLSVKKLVIEYKVKGVPKKVEADENTEAELLPLAAAPAPLWTSRLLANGSLEVTPWKAEQLQTLRKETGKPIVIKTPAPMDVGLSQNWQVKFQANRGAPPTASFAELVSWPERKEPGIKYFSGSASYVKSFDLTPGFMRKGRSVRLDLGMVKNFATVTLNGRVLRTLWKPPFALDVTGLVKPGRNTLEVKVTNLWANRVIGDEALPPEVEWNGRSLKQWPAWLKPGEPRIAASRPKTGRITFATWHHFTKDSPLLPSGLLGPVKIQSALPIIVKP